MYECYLVLGTTVSTRTVLTLGYWNYPRAALFVVKVCPVVRQSDHLLIHVSDFQALENMATAQDEEQDIIHPAPEPAETSAYPPQQPSSASWFARYMHFAQRKRRSRGHRSPSETGLSQ